MKISKWSILILMLTIGLTGCKKEEDDEIPVTPQGDGTIFVSVVYNGQPVSGAVVTTDPETSEATTDETGTALIESVGDGIYQIFATQENIGSGSAAVAVDPGDVSDATVHLIAGVFSGPMVNIVWVSPQTAGVGDTVSVTAMVHDLVDEDEDILFEWSTNVDGVISNQGVDESGNANLEYVFETLGQRVLTVTATNSEGESNSDHVPINIVDVPDPVVLEITAGQNFVPQLSWSPTNANNFSAYRVYRQSDAGSSSIQYINNINTTSYTDTEVELDTEYTYKVGIQLTNGFEVMSNEVTWQFEGDYIEVETGLDMMLHDPNNPMIYGLDTDNNSLVFINTELGEVVTSFYVGSTPSDMDFSLDNQLLYIANSGSTEITVVDLASQSVQSSFYVDTEIGTWDDNPSTLAVMANGLLAFSGGDGFNNIKLVDITSGENVFTTSNSILNPYISANSDGTKLFVAEASGSSSEVFRYDLVNDELVEVQDSENLYNNVQRLLITDNDEFVFFAKRKLLASNLPSNLGGFDDYIYAINSDGSRVLGESEVFDGNDYNTLGGLPISTKVSVFGNDNSTAYLYHYQTARLYVVTIE